MSIGINSTYLGKQTTKRGEAETKRVADSEDEGGTKVEKFNLFLQRAPCLISG